MTSAGLLPVAILLAPLAVAALLLFFGKRLKHGDWLATGVMALCFLGSCITYYEVVGKHDDLLTSFKPALSIPFVAGEGSDAEIPSYSPAAAQERVGPALPWIAMGDTGFSLGLYLDPLGSIMLIIVTCLATLVMVFTTWYLHGDPLYRRFWWSFSFFCFAMIGVVLSGNLLMTFIFWELVGLGSYLLIGFWYHKPAAADDPDYQAMKARHATGIIEAKLSPADAQLKAFVMNRIGDAGFIIGLSLFAWATWHWAAKTGHAASDLLSWHTLFQAVADGAFNDLSLLGFSGTSLLTIAGAGVFLGAMGKSAQFPLHTWLPDAMQGPTTASAIIHAATMVAAGVFLVARIHPVLTPDALAVVGLVGAITCFVAATIACVQWDLKAVLAYSTISQLGYMMLGLGAGIAVGGYAASIAHLYVHAIFKCLLFLCAAAVIHACDGNQDLGRLGGLRKKMPFTAIASGIAVLAIAGYPLFGSYYSKDGILAAVAMSAEHHAAGCTGVIWAVKWLPFVLGMVSSVLTAYYMTRWWLRIFMGPLRDPAATAHAHDPWPRCLVVMAILVVGCFQFSWTHQILPWATYAWLDGVIVAKAYGLHAAEAMNATTPLAALDGPTVHHFHLYHDITAVIIIITGCCGTAVAVLLFWWSAWRQLHLASSLRRRNVFSWLWDATAKLWYLEYLYDALFVRGLGKGLGRLLAATDLGTRQRLESLDAETPPCPFGRPSLDGAIDLSGRIASGFSRIAACFQDGRITTTIAWTAVAVMVILLLVI